MPSVHLATVGRIGLWTVLGATLGLAFGAAFGAFATVFRGGPTLSTGVVESAEWFAVAGAAGALLFRAGAS